MLLIKIRKNCLEKVETRWIHEYQEKYKDKLLNKRMLKEKKGKREVNFKANIEKQSDLEKRTEELGIKIKIKDNEKNKFFFYDVKVDGTRYKTMARYNEENKDLQLEKIKKKKKKLIDAFIIDFM